MRLDLKTKAPLETPQSMQQPVVVMVATKVDAVAGVEAILISMDMISSVATSIEGMNSVAMSNMVMISEVDTILAVMEAAMVGAARGTAHKISSTVVINRLARSVVKLATLL
jgi:hypothetical protein